jgi:hypothetical protein
MRRITAALTCLTLAWMSRADEFGASIRALIEAHQQVIKVAETECAQGDGIACDKVLVSQARISLLKLELRHRSGRVHEALEDVDSAMSDLEDTVDNE